MANLYDLAPKSDVFTVKLVHPSTSEPLLNEDGSQMSVSLYRDHTPEFMGVMFDLAEADLNAEADLAKDGDEGGEVPEVKRKPLRDIVHRNNEVTILTVSSWNITYGDKGQKPRCTEKNVREVVGKLPWILGQIKAAKDNIENFT